MRLRVCLLISEKFSTSSSSKKAREFDSLSLSFPFSSPLSSMPSLLRAATADDDDGHDAAPLARATNGDGGEERDAAALAATASASTDFARALLACSAASWPLSLRRLSFATELVPLPEDVAAWMRSGGRVWLPEGSGAVRFLLFFFLFTRPLSLSLSSFSHLFLFFLPNAKTLSRCPSAPRWTSSTSPRRERSLAEQKQQREKETREKATRTRTLLPLLPLRRRAS